METLNETLFENRCRYTRAILLEMSNRIRRPARIVMLVCVAVLLACAALYWFYLGDSLMTAVCAALAALFAAYEALVLRLSVRSTLQRYQELYHAPLESRTFFYDDYILNTNEQTKGELRLEYTQLTALLETKHLYLLRLRRQLVVPVDKDGFVGGERSAFERFIREKAVKAKIRL